MWKFCTYDDYPGVILHDCFITEMRVEGDDLLFDFDDGFWLQIDHAHNPFDKVLRTGPAQLRFECCDFDQLRFAVDFRKYERAGGTKRDVSLNTMRDMAASRKWRPEIIDEAYTERSVTLSGSMRCRREPHYRDFVFHIPCVKRLYCWNHLREDKAW